MIVQGSYTILLLQSRDNWVRIRTQMILSGGGYVQVADRRIPGVTHMS